MTQGVVVTSQTYVYVDLKVNYILLLTFLIILSEICNILLEKL